MLDVLFIDNFDSFVFNLADEFEKRGCRVEVYRNNISVDTALKTATGFSKNKLVVLSPGPGTPNDAGCCVELVRRAPDDLPVFGVCLGHQAITEAFEGSVGFANEIVHGKTSTISHEGRGIFKGLGESLVVGRYHSLIAQTIPDQFRITAKLGQMVMAMEHKRRNISSVQFHPESILTPMGGKIIDNVISCAQIQENER